MSSGHTLFKYCVNMVTYGISTSQYVLNLRYRPHCSKYKDLCYKPQNHSKSQNHKITNLLTSVR